MPDFDLSGELSLKIELHMLRPITEKVHSGNGPVSLVLRRATWIWTIRAFWSEAISNRYTYRMITGTYVWLLLSDGQPFPM